MFHSVEILAYDGAPCPYCNGAMKIRTKNQQPTRDHIIPQSRQPGSPLRMACWQCNHDKANRTLVEWLDVLDRSSDPRTPIVGNFIKNNQHLSLIPDKIQTDIFIGTENQLSLSTEQKKLITVFLQFAHRSYYEYQLFELFELTKSNSKKTVRRLKQMHFDIMALHRKKWIVGTNGQYRINPQVIDFITRYPDVKI